MSRYKSYKYRIYPNKQQREIFAQNFGCVRFVYNFFLTMKRQEYSLWYKSPSKKCCSSELTKLKKEESYEWLASADSTALQSALADLENAYKNFFNKTSGYPKYKSKKNYNDSYTTKNNNDSIELTTKKVKLPKVGWIKTKVSRPTEGRIVKATVSRVPSGKYYVSVTCEVGEMMYVQEGTTEKRVIGLDLGINDLIVAYDGKNTYKVSNPQNLDKSLKTLAHEQRSLSRKTNGSKRYSLQRIKVARLHESITNQRNDLLDKLSTALVMNYDIICIENLDIRGMIKQTEAQSDKSNHEKSTRVRHIQDSSWGTFVRMLEYKCTWYGKTLVKVGKYFPSSQTCSCCGNKNPAVKDTKIRNWKCPVCGTNHDRDENAAKNILKEGLKVYQSAKDLAYPTFGAVLVADDIFESNQASA